MAKINSFYSVQPSFVQIRRVDITPNDGSEKKSLLDANTVVFKYEEHMFRDTVEASIVMKDTGGNYNGKSLIEGLTIVGSEDVNIKLMDGFDNKLDLNLIVNKVTTPEVNTKSEIVVLNLVSEEKIRNEQETATVKKRYDGRISDTVKKILEENLKTTKIGEIESTTNNYNFIGNRQKPLYILKWLAKKSLHKDHHKSDTAAYICYQNHKGFNFKSLDTLMNEKLNPIKEKFIYSENNEGAKIVSKFSDTKVIKFNVDNSMTANKKLRMGAYKTKLIIFDPFNCEYEEIVEESKDVDKIIAGKELPKLNKKFSDVPTRTTYVLKDTGTLPSGDVEEQLKLSDKEIFEPAKILNQSIRRLNNLALYNIDIEINLDLSYKIGDAVFIDFKSLTTDNDGQFNKMIGGRYLVFSLNQTITASTATTRLGLVRESVGRKVSQKGVLLDGESSTPIFEA